MLKQQLHEHTINHTWLASNIYVAFTLHDQSRTI